MSVSDEEPYSTIFASLKHPIRRKILRMLSRNPMSFSEMLDTLGVSNSFLTYHLENLGELVNKKDDGRYSLSSLGEAAISTMARVEDIPTSIPHQPRRLNSKKLNGMNVTSVLAVVSILLIASLGGAVAYCTTIIHSQQGQLDFANSMTNRLNANVTGLQNEAKQIQTWLDGNETFLNQARNNITNLQEHIDWLNSIITSLESQVNLTLYTVRNINTGLNYTSIQDAINANETVNGNTIFIENGNYHENVVANKSLVVIGESIDNTIVDGNGTGPVFSLTAQNVSLANFTAVNAGPHSPGAILLNQTENCVIESVKALNSLCGIALLNSSNNMVSQSEASNNKYVGIQLMNSNKSTILNNTVFENQIGIVLGGQTGSMSSNNVLADNQVFSNLGSGVYMGGLGNNVTSNQMWNNTLGLGLDMAEDSSVTFNSILNSQTGISFSNGAENNTILSNNVTGNSVNGILLTQYSQNNTITANTIQTSLYGIYAEKASGSNLITENTIQSNSYGLFIDWFSGNNTIYHNGFVNNTNQILLQYGSSNTWDNGSEGNYWSDYLMKYPNATENNDTWNTPYIIDANNLDHHPLVNQVIIPELPILLILPLFTIVPLLALLFIRKKQISEIQSI